MAEKKCCSQTDAAQLTAVRGMKKLTLKLLKVKHMPNMCKPRVLLAGSPQYIDLVSLNNMFLRNAQSVIR